MTVEDVATELDLSPDRVRKLCQAGKFGRKLAGVWIIGRDELDAYKLTRRRPGRPPTNEDEEE